MSDDDFDGPETPLVGLLRARACPAGLPYTGDDPTADHGHTDCWLHHRAASRIEELEAAALRAYVPLATTTARRSQAARIAEAALAEVLGVGDAEARQRLALDVYEWIAYGVERGWVTEACATHDGIPSTPQEDEWWEDGLDPCQHVLRLWPDGKPPARRGDPAESAPFFAHAHPDHAASTWEDGHGVRRHVDPRDVQTLGDSTDGTTEPDAT